MIEQTLMTELETLVAQTYLLWEPGWVTFNWREYTWDHVQRVRALAHTFAQREEADTDVVSLAALLHDVTKSYDGEYVTDAFGQRVVDANGQWHNVARAPVGANEVTRLYAELALTGTLHNVSGARVAQALLQRRNVPLERLSSVTAAIEEHLSPPDNAGAESLCLYDADTIDANIGLPAFVRNIYIHVHFFGERNPTARPLAQTLLDAPLDYLDPYVREKLRPWSHGKLRDFVPRLRTASGRELALARLQRLDEMFDALLRELDDPAPNLASGRLAVLLHYMRHHERASIAAETGALQQWATLNGACDGARSLVRAIANESAGLE